MPTLEPQNVQAIDLHSVQANIFASRYGAYSADAYKDCFVYSRHRLQVWLDRFLPQTDRPARLLDVGCGTGHYIAEFLQRGYDVVGIDGSSEMLEHARQVNPGAELHLADVDALPFPDQSFDRVLCIEVVRYLPDPTRCLQEMARVLKPGGVCLFTAMPLLNLNGYWLINRLAGLVRLGNLVRLRQYFTTSWTIRRQCRNAGFLSPTIHGVYTGPINWVERIAPQILPRFLRGWERLDVALADQPVLREFSNMFLVHAVRR
jgi:ubiquinone/menaquinone biosynthesis C-methylase UbiE